MTAAELRRQYEIEVNAMFDNASKAKMLIAYQYLKAYGCSMESIEYNIEKALKTESEMLTAAGK